jgi:20S proteasome alpha/beta subunit
MTLLVSLRGRDALVLAADSRGTFGDPRSVTAQNDAMQKAYLLSPRAAVLVAGAAELGEQVIQDARRAISDRGAVGVTECMNALRDTVRGNFNGWFPSIAPIQPQHLLATGQVASRPDVAFIVSGYDDAEPRTYSLNSQLDFPPMLSNYGFAVQGVAQYALYLLNRLYEPDRSVEELTALAVYVITETASQDGKVGGPVNVVTIEHEGGARVLDRAMVDEVSADNDRRSRVLRDSFYEGEVVVDAGHARDTESSGD